MYEFQLDGVVIYLVYVAFERFAKRKIPDEFKDLRRVFVSAEVTSRDIRIRFVERFPDEGGDFGATRYSGQYIYRLGDFKLIYEFPPVA